MMKTANDQTIRSSTLKTLKSRKLKKDSIEACDKEILYYTQQIAIHQQKIQNQWSKHVRNKYESEFYDTSAKSEKSDVTAGLIKGSQKIDQNILFMNQRLKHLLKKREKLLKKQEK